MIELACRYGSGPVQLASVADNQKISTKYLHAVMQQLKIAGLVRTIRGAHGGFELSRSPSEIMVIEVIEAIDGPVAVVDCVIHDCAFQRSTPCVAQGIWCDITAAIRGAVDTKSLADLVEKVGRQGSTALDSPRL